MREEGRVRNDKHTKRVGSGSEDGQEGRRKHGLKEKRKRNKGKKRKLEEK